MILLQNLKKMSQCLAMKLKIKFFMLEDFELMLNVDNCV